MITGLIINGWCCVKIRAQEEVVERGSGVGVFPPTASLTGSGRCQRAIMEGKVIAQAHGVWGAFRSAAMIGCR